MRSTIYQIAILAILWCFVLITMPHVDASNVTYSDEYYILTNNANIIFNKCSIGDPSYGNWVWCSQYNFYLMSSSRDKAIQIAIEKQNELIAEQNEKLDRLINLSIDRSGNKVDKFYIDPTAFGVKNGSL